MPIFALGLNHRTAPLPVREALAFSPEEQKAALAPLRTHTGAKEVVLVSTCNRSEIYLGGEGTETLDHAVAWLTRFAGRTDLDTHLYRLRDEAVARHIFRVASGLDSMVLGETQILGQVKRAVRLAEASGTLGGPVDRLFQHTFSVAKEVRARTAIGESSVSMAAAAVKLAQQLFGDLSRIKLLLIGAGEMIEGVATHFAAHAPREMAIANRTLERCRELARSSGGHAMALADVPARLHEFDAVVSCTASTLPLIGKGMVERALRSRKHRPMFIVDLAVPRDVEPEVAELPDVFLHTVDSLGAITREGWRRRGDAVAEADAIIEARVDEFSGWLRSRAAVPAIRELRSRAEHFRQIELARARKRLARGEDPARVLEALSLGLANKFLHHPMQALQSANDEERELLARTVAGLPGN